MTPRNQRRAVALRYTAGVDSAPVVLAKGSGYRADRIKALAAEHGVRVREDPELVDALSQLEEGTEIPLALYAAVAELLAFVYRAEGRLGGRQEIQDRDHP